MSEDSLYPHTYRGEERIDAALRWASTFTIVCQLGEDATTEIMIALAAWGWWSPMLTRVEIEGVVARVHVVRRDGPS